MRKILLALASLFLLLGCDLKAWEAKRIEELDKRTFTSTAFNYTQFDIYSILYKDASVKFDVNNAVDGGSVFFRMSSNVELDNGTNAAMGGNTCCLIWGEPTDKPLRVRVVWSVIYDLDDFDGKSSDQRDPRSIRGRGRGNTWCEAFVDILPAKTNVPADSVVFHFLADGTVQAQLDKSPAEKPLASLEVAKHSTPLAEGQICRREIDNPFYNVPRTPHRE